MLIITDFKSLQSCQFLLNSIYNKSNKYYYQFMLKILLTLIVSGLVSHISAQTYRWQQRVEYKMEIDFDDKNHQFQGKQILKLWNNSPDTLSKIYYHLYFNAFQPNSDMDIRSSQLPDPDSRIGDRIGYLSEHEQGFHTINLIKQANAKLNFSVAGTILEVKLHKVLPPGMSTQIEMNFSSQVPVQIRRSGRNNQEGIAYSMAQWYPKLCNYDEQGWHTSPYIAREFYAPFGDFFVTISMDKKYCIAAGGILLNPHEVGCGYSNQSTTRVKKIWKFSALNVHDFVWAADTAYTHTTFKRKNGCLLRFFYKKNEKTADNWSRLPIIIDKALDFIEPKYGPYPYKTYSFIQGGDGGMEYPMATLITANRSINSLVGVSIHELMHSWYQMMLATNESLYPWMDEGFTSFTEAEVINYLKKEKLLEGEADPDPQLENILNYTSFAVKGQEEPLSTHSDHYNTNRAYGVGSYVKGAVCLAQLKYIMGQEPFDKALLDYYWKWRFRHPNPNDFFRIMEKASDLELDWFKEYFVYSTKLVDYKIDTVFSSNQNTICKLQRVELFPMPVEIEVTLKNNTKKMYYIPLNLMLGRKQFPLEENIINLPAWSWVNPNYEFTINENISNVQKIKLNPQQQLIDINSKNDIFINN